MKRLEPLGLSLARAEGQGVTRQALSELMNARTGAQWIWRYGKSTSGSCRPESSAGSDRRLDAAPAEGLASPHEATAIRSPMLTGCRCNVGLRWEDVDLEAGELRRRDSKTDARVIVSSRSWHNFRAPSPMW